jgi:hypothetical protein
MARARIRNLLLVFLVFTIICGSIPTPWSVNPKKLQVIISENGIFNCIEVIDSINRYFDSIAYLGFETSISKISQTVNNEIGIDSFIENQYYTKGIETFILVGNDIKFPIRVNEERMIATPADGVLCDTNHEIIFEGWNQTIKPFTAEVTVAYIFPPKQGLSIDGQRKQVIHAFNKFEKFHRGMVTYSNTGLACGHSDTSDFMKAISRMASASKLFEKWDNRIELSKTEIKAYFQENPTYFGVAGHGSPYAVETSSTGTQLDWTDLSNCRTPLMLEIFGCWVSGWNFESISDPWNALDNTLSMSSIFDNDYTMVIVAGFPESADEYSFSGNVLSEFGHDPSAALGELMRNKARRCGDWVLFGDPALIIKPPFTENSMPVASIEYLYPTMIEQGSVVYFKGYGTDRDGTIVAYNWRSNLDGQLSTSNTFSTSTLSVGAHTICFKVKDNDGSWSEEVVGEVAVFSAPVVYIAYPINEETVEGLTTISVNVVFGKGTLRAVAFYIDGNYAGYDATSPYGLVWDTRSYKNGEHRLRVEASFYNPVRTIRSAETIVNVNNPLPSVKIVSPVNGSILQGSCKITVEATNVDKIVKANLYIDGVFFASDYLSPFEWTWDTTTKQNGLHELYAEVYYSHIRQYIKSPKTVVSVQNPKSEVGVIILSPTNGSEVRGTITIQVLATGENLNRVYFYIDGLWKGYDLTSPYTLQWNTLYLSEGWHEIYAVALYGKSAPLQEVKSETIRILVNN